MKAGHFPHPDCCPTCDDLALYLAYQQTPTRGGFYRAYYVCGKGHRWSTTWADNMTRTMDDLVSEGLLSLAAVRVR